MKKIILSIWDKFSDTQKVKIISGWNTFSTTFVIAIATTIYMGGVVWSTSFWIALATAGLREAVKAVFAQFVPIRLGGKK